MDTTAIIAIATAIAIGIVNLVIKVNEKMNKKKNPNRFFPCKAHEDKIQAHKEQISALFTKNDNLHEEFNDLLVAYTKEMTTIGTTLNMFIASNDKEHKAILEAIEKVSNRR